MYISLQKKKKIWSSSYSNESLIVTSHQYEAKLNEDIPTYQCMTKSFKLFYSRTISEWNKIDLSIQKLSYPVLRKQLLYEISLATNLI